MTLNIEEIIAYLAFCALGIAASVSFGEESLFRNIVNGVGVVTFFSLVLAVVFFGIHLMGGL